MKTEIVCPADAERAVALLRAGEVVALPTETVYGLAADALNVEAVLKIFEAKERPRFDPLIVHLPAKSWLEEVAHVPADGAELVARLSDAFWPGPFTLVLPATARVPDVVTAGLKTVALRISAHPVFAEIIRAFGAPLAAPSANRFGRISPTSAEHVRVELDGRIPLIVAGGSTRHGLESTIVAPRNGVLEVLRHGPITREQLAEFGSVREAAVGSRPEAPGQLPSHYAPRTPLVLTDDAKSFAIGEKKIGVLVHPRDLREAAASLFARLRELDESGVELIVAERAPDEGLGVAINDRLRRAAAKRDLSSDARDRPG